MSNAHDFTFTSLAGEPLPMTDFAGKAVLVVNTASKCGLTPQYAGLQALYAAYRDQGLVVLGVPCNQFAGQEPGDEAQIATFCSTNFNIDFPMTAKTDVKDAARHPFYAWADEALGEAAVPVWNVHKILIGRAGEAVAAFGPRTEPMDPAITAAVQSLL